LSRFRNEDRAKRRFQAAQPAGAANLQPMENHTQFFDASYEVPNRRRRTIILPGMNAGGLRDGGLFDGLRYFLALHFAQSGISGRHNLSSNGIVEACRSAE
jgi:hypothetical protein